MELISTIQDTIKYLNNLNFIDKSNLKNKLNYEIGVPSKKLEKIKNVEELVKVCYSYKKFPSELQKDLDQEIKYYLSKQP